MATISVHRPTGQDLTIFTVVGDLTADEIVEALSSAYAPQPTNRILWDLSEGSLNDLTADGFRRIAEVVKLTRPPSPLARTVYVGSADMEYGLMRMYVALAESARVPVNHMICRTRAAALEWLADR